MSKQNWLIAGIVAGALAIVICCACAITGVVWWTRDDPGDVVDSYLTAVQEHDDAKAAELTCDDMGPITGMVSRWTDVVDWDIEEVETHKRSAEVTARVTFRVLGVTSSGRVVFTLVKEDGDWRVCGLRSGAGQQ